QDAVRCLTAAALCTPRTAMPGITIALVQSAPPVPWAADATLAGFDVHLFAAPGELLRASRHVAPAIVVLSDIAGGTWAAIESAAALKRAFPSAPIVLIATDSSEAT